MRTETTTPTIKFSMNVCACVWVKGDFFLYFQSVWQTLLAESFRMYLSVNIGFRIGWFSVSRQASNATSTQTITEHWNRTFFPFSDISYKYNLVIFKEEIINRIEWIHFSARGTKNFRWDPIYNSSNVVCVTMLVKLTHGFCHTCMFGRWKCKKGYPNTIFFDNIYLIRLFLLS